jgi:acid phosphatase class B
MNWYKKAQMAMRKVVSFDFDSTIFHTYWDEEENDFVRNEATGEIEGDLNEEIAGLIRSYSSKGWKVILVTSRTSGQMQEVEEFVAKHSLPLEEIHSTNGALKAPLLKELGAIIHYDDDDAEINAIRQIGGIEAIQV